MPHCAYCQENCKNVDKFIPKNASNTMKKRPSFLIWIPIFIYNHCSDDCMNQIETFSILNSYNGSEYHCGTQCYFQWGIIYKKSNWIHTLLIMIGYLRCPPMFHAWCLVSIVWWRRLGIGSTTPTSAHRGVWKYKWILKFDE